MTGGECRRKRGEGGDKEGGGTRIFKRLIMEQAEFRTFDLGHRPRSDWYAFENAEIMHESTRGVCVCMCFHCIYCRVRVARGHRQKTHLHEKNRLQALDGHPALARGLHALVQVLPHRELSDVQESQGGKYLLISPENRSRVETQNANATVRQWQPLPLWCCEPQPFACAKHQDKTREKKVCPYASCTENGETTSRSKNSRCIRGRDRCDKKPGCCQPTM